MVEIRATVKNRLGIHARPAAYLVKASSKFDAEVTFEKDRLEVNGKSIMGVMMLAAETGAEIIVRANGSDESDAAKELAGMIESELDIEGM
ncbi:TPA: phosphocarrier protein HPr [Candidatus Latescibacteria bacterium]|nr:phosphocarrier protein HPr [Candidatus Latescibacterota bacterium]